MADQKITELPIKTSSGIAATDYLLGIDSAEGYQMLIQDLGNYIINNVSATLGGASQTLAAAIGSAYNLAKSPGAIANNTDLNTIVTPGHYAASNSAAASCVNCPVARGFRLTVETGLTGTTNAWLRQTLIQGENGDTYTRHTTNTGATWTEWKKIATEGDVPVVISSAATSSAAYTSLDDIPLNSVGQARFAASISPFGTEANLPYACFGSAAYRMIIVGRISSAENIYINTGNTSSWYGWKQIDNAPRQLSGITSLSDIPLGSNGYVQLDASVSPVGATTSFTYWCTGIPNRRSLIVVYAISSETKAYVNALHNDDGVTWKGWKAITLS